MTNCSHFQISQMYFDLPAIHDTLERYIGPKHNLHAVCKSFKELYDSSFFRNQSRYKGYSGFVSLPAHNTTLRSKLTSIIKQENFAIDISCLHCLECAVYSEHMRLQTNAIFAKLVVNCAHHWHGFWHVLHVERTKTVHVRAAVVVTATNPRVSTVRPALFFS